MFEMDDKKKEMKESLLEKLIDHLMMAPDEGSEKEEASEEPTTEAIESALGSDKEKPKVEMKVMEVKAKPKFIGPDGTEMEDESIEDILKRKAKG